MLKGISPLISPELLGVLARMGHGDEIVLADAHFPDETVNSTSSATIENEIQNLYYEQINW